MPPRSATLFWVARIQFSLRTMLVLVAVLAVLLAYNTRWIRQRRAYLADHPKAIHPRVHDIPTRAPGLLWLFGERGWQEVQVQVPGFESKKEFHKTQAGPEAEEARRLFPEANIVAKEKNTIWYTWMPGTRWAWGAR